MERQMATEALTVGTKVMDRSGYPGTIIVVTEWRGSRWYNVRFLSGTAVRYDDDLTPV